MYDLETALEGIRGVVGEYNSEEVLTDQDFKRMHRKLSSELYALNESRCKYKDEWDSYYSLCKEKTNAAKERYADMKVPELYKCRKIWEAGENVLISINNQLKY